MKHCPGSKLSRGALSHEDVILKGENSSCFRLKTSRLELVSAHTCGRCNQKDERLFNSRPIMHIHCMQMIDCKFKRKHLHDTSIDSLDTHVMLYCVFKESTKLRTALMKDIHRGICRDPCDQSLRKISIIARLFTSLL